MVDMRLLSYKKKLAARRVAKKLPSRSVKKVPVRKVSAVQRNIQAWKEKAAKGERIPLSMQKKLKVLPKLKSIPITKKVSKPKLSYQEREKVLKTLRKEVRETPRESKTGLIVSPKIKTLLSKIHKLQQQKRAEKKLPITEKTERQERQLKIHYDMFGKKPLDTVPTIKPAQITGKVLGKTSAQIKVNDLEKLPAHISKIKPYKLEPIDVKKEKIINFEKRVKNLLG